MNAIVTRFDTMALFVINAWALIAWIVICASRLFSLLFLRPVIPPPLASYVTVAALPPAFKSRYITTPSVRAPPFASFF
jgi:hypothetical protein